MQYLSIQEKAILRRWRLFQSPFRRALSDLLAARAASRISVARIPQPEHWREKIRHLLRSTRQHPFSYFGLLSVAVIAL